MSSTSIEEAKRRLPLPSLLEQLGLGEHARKSARCPFHEDKNPSFSVFQMEGAWFFKCHTGCGQGDEITLLEMYYGISTAEAIERYVELAGGSVGIAGGQKHSRKPRLNDRTQVISSGTTKQCNWDECVAAFRESDLQKLATWRCYRDETVRLLLKEKKLGIYNGCVAFPVEDDTGNVIGAHYRLGDGSWRYTPGVNAAPLIIGNVSSMPEIHIMESPWDAVALLDRLPIGAQIATNGAGNSRLLLDLLPRFNQEAKVYLWPQNDAAGQKWFANVSSIIPDTVGVRIPATYKDLNDWTKAGANWDVLSAASVESAQKRNSELVPNKSTLPDLASVLGEIVSVLQRNITFSSEHQAGCRGFLDCSHACY